MISSQLTSVLSNLGWGSGFRLPVANEENRALENLLEQKQKRLLEVHATLEVDTQHCTILQSHFDRISTAVKETQKMTNAKRSGLETEQNLKDLADKMYSRYKTDLHEAKQEILQYNERNYRMSEEIENRRQVIEELIATVKFDQVALQRFKQVTEDKESYINFVQTMATLDERVAQDFQLKFRKVGEELHNSRAKLNDAAINTLSLQQQFGRLCQQFRRIHAERSQAIQLWEGTLRSMRQRDENIKEVAEEYAHFRSRVQYLDLQCERNKDMIKHEELNTQEIEYQISSADKNCNAIKIKLVEFRESQTSLGDDILTYNSIINQTSSKLKQLQAQLANLDNEIENIQKQIQKLELEVVDAKLRHGMAMTETLTEETRTKEIEQLIQKEEIETDKVIREIERFRRLLWTRVNECNEIEAEIKLITGRIRGARGLILSLKDRAKDDDVKLTREKQQAYRLELECLALDTKLKQLTTVQDQDYLPSSVTKNDAIELNQKLQEVTKTRTFLQAQESHLSNMNKRLYWELDAVRREYSQLQVIVDSLKMEAKRCVLEHKKSCEDVQNLQLETRLLQMTLKRFQKLANEERDSMHSLEQDRLLMETAVKERKSEIEVHVQLLKAQQRLLRDDVSKINSYITDVSREISLCKTRYEYTMNSLASDGGDGDGDHSESYYILKHAQEREILRREGDLWDSKVKESEREIAALQNTLSVLVSSNLAFKDSLSPAAAETPEAKILGDLEEEQRLTLVRKRKSDKHLQEVHKQCLARESELAEASHTKMFLEGLLGEKKYEMSNLHFEIASQKEKIIRANRMANRLIKELGLHVHPDRETIELDLKLRCAKEKFEYGLKTLEKTLFVHQNMRSRALQFAEESEELQPIVRRLTKRLEMPEFDTVYATRSGAMTPLRSTTPTTLSLPPPSRSKSGVFERKMSQPSVARLKSHPSTVRASTASAGRRRSAPGIAPTFLQRSKSVNETLPKPSVSWESVTQPTESKIKGHKSSTELFLAGNSTILTPDEGPKEESGPEDELIFYEEAEIHSISEDEAQLVPAERVSEVMAAEIVQIETSTAKSGPKFNQPK